MPGLSFSPVSTHFYEIWGKCSGIARCLYAYRRVHTHTHSIETERDWESSLSPADGPEAKVSIQEAAWNRGGYCAEAQADQSHTEDEDHWCIIPTLGGSHAEWAVLIQPHRWRKQGSWPRPHNEGRAKGGAQANLTLRPPCYFSPLSTLFT